MARVLRVLKGPWMDVLTSVFNAMLDWLGQGFSGFSGWEVLAYTLFTSSLG